MTALIITAILVAFGWLAHKKPAYALGALLALAPAYLIRFSFAIPTTMLELLLADFLLIILLDNFRDLAPLKNLGRLNWAVGLFVAAGIVSVLVSPEKARALGQLKAFIIEPALLFYAVVLVGKKHGFGPALKILFWAASAISLFGLFQHYTLLMLPMRFWGVGLEPRRITSVFEYPNALALYLAPLFVMFVCLWLKKYPLGRHRVWLILGLAVQGIAILMTYSRGAWLAVGITLILLALEHFSVKKLLPILIALGIIALLIAPIRHRLLDSIHDPSGTARVDLARAGWNKLRTNPIFGNGLYGFRTTLEQQNFSGEILNYPHNIILNFWLETGLLGLLSFAAVVYYSIHGYKNRPTILGLAAVCFLAAVIIHGAVDVPYFKNDLAILFWFAVGLLQQK
jgi:O-antigen ligase